MKGRLTLLGALALSAVGTACTTDNTSRLTVDVTAVAVDSMVRVTMTWRPGADDGYGALSGYLVSASGGLPLDADSAQVASNLRTATITLGPYALGSTQSGQGCVKALRRQRSSTPACKPWSVTLTDVAPPPPILDSVRTSAVHDTLRVQAFFRPGTADGNGTVNNIVIRAGDNTGTDVDSLVSVAAAGNATFYLTGYSYGQSVAGFACVYATRRGLQSSSACSGFTQVITDQDPPPPVLDSVVALRIMPDSAKLAAMFPACSSATTKVDAEGFPVPACVTTVSGQSLAAVQQFCGMFKKNDGYYYIVSGQENLKYCHNQYDLLPAGTKLPGYPTATLFVPDGRPLPSLAYLRVPKAKIVTQHPDGQMTVTQVSMSALMPAVMPIMEAKRQ